MHDGSPSWVGPGEGASKAMNMVGWIHWAHAWAWLDATMGKKLVSRHGSAASNPFGSTTNESYSMVFLMFHRQAPTGCG